ncbi:hypothetical protein ACF081_11805 [Streptomyces longwoodensis]|uniref:hypothetical protein n=1 Tax=Streptomyces longwoodensis TaxID=68231 RepID=UPI00370276FC
MPEARGAHASAEVYTGGIRRSAPADEQVTALAGRAAAHATLDDPSAVALLLQAHMAVGSEGSQSTVLWMDDDGDRRDPVRQAEWATR